MTENRQALLGAVGRATQAYQRATDGFDDEVGRQLGLNPSDLRCLDWLTEGAMSAGELADATGLSGAATTSLLDRLEEKGYVRRVRDTVDRRKVRAALTPRGSRRLWKLYGPLADEGAALLSGFDRAQLVRMRDFLVEATKLVDRHRARLRIDAVTTGSANEATSRVSASGHRRRPSAATTERV